MLNDNQIEVTAPGGNSTVGVMVTTPTGTSPPSSPGFVYLAAFSVGADDIPGGQAISGLGFSVWGNGFAPATTVIFTPVGGGVVVESPAVFVNNTMLWFKVILWGRCGHLGHF